MKPNFADAALHQYEATDEALHDIPSLTKQRALLWGRADAAGASPSILRSAPVGKYAEANVELVKSVVDDDKNWDLEGRMTGEGMETSELRGQLQSFKNYRTNFAIFTGKFRKGWLKLLR